VEPPFSGKNASGSVCAHSADPANPCHQHLQDGRRRALADDDLSQSASSLFGAPDAHSHRGRENHTNGITPARLASRQARKVVLAPWLSKLRGKFFKKLRTACAQSPLVATCPDPGGSGAAPWDIGYGVPRRQKATVRRPPGAARYDGGFCHRARPADIGVGSPPGQALRHCRYADYRACRRVGAARFLRACERPPPTPRSPSSATPPTTSPVCLRVCPDLDT